MNKLIVNGIIVAGVIVVLGLALGFIRVARYEV